MQGDNLTCDLLRNQIGLPAVQSCKLQERQQCLPFKTYRGVSQNEGVGPPTRPSQARASHVRGEDRRCPCRARWSGTCSGPWRSNPHRPSSGLAAQTLEASLLSVRFPLQGREPEREFDSKEKGGYHECTSV